MAQNKLGLLAASTREKTKLFLRKHIIHLTPPCQHRVHYPRKKPIHNWTDSNQAVIAWVRPINFLAVLSCSSSMSQVIHESLGIARGCITTIHNITNTQTVVDAVNSKKDDLRRARCVLFLSSCGGGAFALPPNWSLKDSFQFCSAFPVLLVFPVLLRLIAPLDELMDVVVARPAGQCSVQWLSRRYSASGCCLHCYILVLNYLHVLAQKGFGWIAHKHHRMSLGRILGQHGWYRIARAHALMLFNSTR
jgi:hypothetical protein